MFADLHLHTYFSDSTNSPEELIKLAASAGVELISVCDHHTFTAYEELIPVCKKYNISYITGVEIDAAYEGGNQHILGYCCDTSNIRLAELLRYNFDLLENLSEQLIKRMETDYPDISFSEYSAYQRKPERGGWKGIDYLREKNFIIEYPGCMSYYKNYNCTMPSPFRHVSEVCKIIKNAGGVPVLAHPGDRLDKDNLALHLEKLFEYGIEGVECYYPSHDENLTQELLDICNKHNKYITSGSDDHGDFAKINNNIIYKTGILKTKTNQLNLFDY